MPITETHELHKRRFGRNLGVALCLVGFMAIVFGLTVAKIRQGASMEAFDHQPRVSITPPVEGNQ
ncbi:hypothetical protein GTA62_07915 [Roseobacter sp. HKCCD9010]|jgi:hypothetical protein|uniref:hypothetical protein n=1 Tax=Rhodobacterales TaxID=204455 RepID=UPI00119A464A|nr:MULTISPECIES: hypothetical protein [Rhodobacterales]MBF9051373.1 hypothetical protein [Rhodobacterales bacterium HKCCD4356]NNV13420.1 hypothetical protein [Roseobacter sp. HKCCD7357]NNV17671.1 hypothetical protein [Roseobacter sp. HKCCD8768]NNV27277.1 hypothetical protein [Roseobacter sp. HKCCD8192]NNV31397.1 hypothetical protein [Roseobacter sp. HKCCD9061]